MSTETEYRIDETSVAAPEVLTVPEAASYLRVSANTVRRMVADGQLPAIKLRGAWRFRRIALEIWMEEQESLNQWRA